MSDDEMLDREEQSDDGAEGFKTPVSRHALNDATVANEPAYDVKDSDTRAARSVEGWIVLVTSVHEEATEEEITDKFAEFGEIKNPSTSTAGQATTRCGYTLVEYETMTDAQAAIDGASNTPLLEQTIHCDYAFVRPPPFPPHLLSRSPRCVGQNNPHVVQGYRFIPLNRWYAIAGSVFELHNETLSIHTHFVPVLWGAAFAGVDAARYTPFADKTSTSPDFAESLFTLFALGCLALHQGKLGYFVKWLGYPEDQNSWVTEEDAKGAEILISAS
ncbi:hypothetical protein FB45DRAFT_1041030 [Roridomyces roridus]|uniref:RRM domain-containing protein n=1 Tax=Roridomyces roridus TaxID=1738132 RepID=A0AAD7F966_9AGAR|nr:hypothetical protein FB45DRAFT_1041030 [Roridomyces roridus]